ncbi:erythromycin esterase family protein [Actinomadura sp. NPDC047616]|uniref:erythromycin esterase family protein n=1 Tax=Actinomadura sp. NPDC047616 TaxID=3155914 RepID=UPI0033D204AC
MNLRTSQWPPRLLASAAGMMLVLAGTPAAGHAPTSPVVAWVRHNAVPIDTTDPAAPLGDLKPLRRSAANATVVGLGESIHGAAEQIQLKHRALRLLVEQMGFRTVAWEEDWTTGLLINDYIRTGKGDLDAIMREMSPQWQSRQVADVLRWLRAYNARHADKVQFFGVEYYLTKAAAYDAIEAYVARTAPHRLAELRSHRRTVRPSTSSIWEHITKIANAKDKPRYVHHARQVHALVERLPHRPGDRAHALALHHARQIVSFYVHFTLQGNEAHNHREARAAQNLRWWRNRSRDKVAYWAASPHVAAAPNLRLTMQPPEPDMRFASAGSHLRRWYGQRYRPVGFTLDHGTVSTGPGQTLTLRRPAPGWFEQPFGTVRSDQFVLDLRAPAPPTVRRWLHSPATTRGLPNGGPDAIIDGGTLAQWFEVIVHRQTVTPTHEGSG